MRACSGKRMRKLALAISLLACAGLVWLAAPALSLRPFVPKAIDFEQDLPALKRLAPAATRGHDGEGPTFRSPVIEAPKQFDLVGIAGETREYEIRVRNESGDWSDWIEVADGSPLYTGGARDAQIRAEGFKPSGELHYVNVSGTSGGALDRLLNDTREAINGAFISIASTPIADARKRKPPKPAIVSRASWGADRTDGGGCPPSAPPTTGKVNAGVIHHTVSANGYSPEEAPGIVLGICRFHVYGNGWNDIGYNALVDAYGTIYEGRAGGTGQAIVGAHAEGFNSQTTGVASIGTHTSVPISPAAQGAIVRFLAWKLPRTAAVPATGTTSLTSAGGSVNRYPAGAAVSVPRVLGHGTLDVTECPGAAANTQIATIRRAVQKRIKKFSKRKKRKRGKR